MLFIKNPVFYNKNPKFIKQREGSGSLSNLGIKTSLRKIALIGTLLFYRY